MAARSPIRADERAEVGVIGSQSSEEWVQGAGPQTVWGGGAAWLLPSFLSLDEGPCQRECQSCKEGCRQAPSEECTEAAKESGHWSEPWPMHMLGWRAVSGMAWRAAATNRKKQVPTRSFYLPVSL